LKTGVDAVLQQAVNQLLEWQTAWVDQCRRYTLAQHQTICIRRTCILTLIFFAVINVISFLARIYTT